MTDIRHHLPRMLTSIRQAIGLTDAAAHLRTSLQEQLPASYGIGSGHLVTTDGKQSPLYEVVIYDKTLLSLSTNGNDASCYAIQQVLAVIMLAGDTIEKQLEDCLQQIAQTKQLSPAFQSRQSSSSPRKGQQSRPTLKPLLPLGILGIQRLVDAQDTEPERLALRFDQLLKRREVTLRPDYLLAHAHQLLYSNPLLEGKPFTPDTINIAHGPILKKPHPCYVCKQRFTTAHFFYRYLCLSCGDYNYRKRTISVDLSGRMALVTGARIKIGYATALRLLRAGAHVIVTTRFPHNAAQRYSSEPDFADWQQRLHIYGLDFRHLPTLERFVAHLHEQYPALDILVNNAAQTVRQPASYYAPLLPLEHIPMAELPAAQQELLRDAYAFLPPLPFALPQAGPEPGHQLSQWATSAGHALSHITEERAIAEEASQLAQSLTPSGHNSWTLPLDQIDLTEFLEVQVINVTAPFLLVSRLLPLLRRSPFPQRFIVNVSAVEGQFARTKQGSHIHTNMAKAALNMLTHTGATQLERDHIFMNSVDPGWISQQAPLSDIQTWERIQRLLPLDLVDAAARICDPIFTGIVTGDCYAGGFYKDYQRVTW